MPGIVLCALDVLTHLIWQQHCKVNIPQKKSFGLIKDRCPPGNRVKILTQVQLELKTTMYW